MASILARLFHSVLPRAPHEAVPGPFRVQILGDDDFVSAARSALDLLERDCPDLYQVVIDHVSAIEVAGDGQGRHHEEPPRIYLESDTGHGRDLSARSRAVWYAGAIVHEAWRSKLYREFRMENPSAPWPSDRRSETDRESACLHAQHDVLVRLGAPQWMVDYVGTGMGPGR